MMGGYGIDMGYMLLVLLPGMVLSGLASMMVKRTFKKYETVRAASNITGAEAARMMLARAGVTNCTIEPIAGRLNDHYDPRDRTLRLSEPVYNERSLSAIGVACHEAGHALQHATGYKFLQMRSSDQHRKQDVHAGPDGGLAFDGDGTCFGNACRDPRRHPVRRSRGICHCHPTRRMGCKRPRQDGDDAGRHRHRSGSDRCRQSAQCRLHDLSGGRHYLTSHTPLLPASLRLAAHPDEQSPLVAWPQHKGGDPTTNNVIACSQLSCVFNSTALQSNVSIMSMSLPRQRIQHGTLKGYLCYALRAPRHRMKDHDDIGTRQSSKHHLFGNFGQARASKGCRGASGWRIDCALYCALSKRGH